MIAVIFEVEPAEGRFEDYLEHAARLKPELEKVPGFISVERFQSISNPGKLVSLSFWEDEAAVACWRIHPGHRGSQAAGREESSPATGCGSPPCCGTTAWPSGGTRRRRIPWRCTAGRAGARKRACSRFRQIVFNLQIAVS
ncbi:antibiotic biosynthesis monooxygenase family protein [Dankookia sp. P2]|uniref:antibiotic biosynthesis monooxygenase family protein n=1 Tax=Dankookia sp. P2 TaxID=3423955 RepID=UPI003D66EDCA